MNECGHVQVNYFKDVVIILIVVVGFFVLREILAWLLKTNHSHSLAQKNYDLLQNIVAVLNRNGLQ